jgi:hypothetical protein
MRLEGYCYNEGVHVVDMPLSWVTNSTTRPGPVVNSLNAACEAGYLPDRIYLLSNPKVAAQVDPIRSRANTVVEAYGGDELEVHATNLEDETDFADIVSHYRDAIETAQEADRPVAVDVTPGRKYMSAIAFQAGFRFEADHVFYLHVESNRFYDLSYPEIPRTGIELIDFAEELA